MLISSSSIRCTGSSSKEKLLWIRYLRWQEGSSRRYRLPASGLPLKEAENPGSLLVGLNRWLVPDRRHGKGAGMHVGTNICWPLTIWVSGTSTFFLKFDNNPWFVNTSVFIFIFCNRCAISETLKYHASKANYLGLCASKGQACGLHPSITHWSPFPFSPTLLGGPELLDSAFAGTAWGPKGWIEESLFSLKTLSVSSSPGWLDVLGAQDIS